VADVSLMTLISAEWYRLIRRRMTWILGVLLVGLTIFVYGALALAITGSDAADVDAETLADLERIVEVGSVPAFGDDVVWQLVAVMGVILISATIGSEFSWRTVITNVAWTGDRSRFILSKFVVVTLLTVVGVIVGFITCVIASLGVEVVRGTLGSGDVSAGLFGDIALASVRVFISALVYIFLAASLTMLGRNTALGISVGLAILFLEGLAVPILDLLGDSFAWTKDILMNWNVQGLLAANGYIPGVASAPDPDLPGAWQATVVLLIYAAAYAAATILIFRRRDITE
jgi:ABC-type transport system involved in multi-copper enzyme maturation permease subunit